MASLSLKCDQDWLRDEEVENREVTLILFFGLLDLVCLDIETACRSSFITMKLNKTTSTTYIYKGLSQ